MAHLLNALCSKSDYQVKLFYSVIFSEMLPPGEPPEESTRFVEPGRWSTPILSQFVPLTVLTFHEILIKPCC
jgi:hypothetical protein